MYFFDFTIANLPAGENTKQGRANVNFARAEKRNTNKNGKYVSGVYFIKIELNRVSYENYKLVVIK